MIKLNWWPFFLILIIPVMLWLAVPYYSGDVKNHVAWAASILEKGTWGFYEREFPGFAFPNYPPLMMLLFAGSLKLYQLINEFAWSLNLYIGLFPSNLISYLQWENTQIAFLKLPAILANVGTAYAIYLLSKKNKALALLFLLNPATFYLSVTWGQVDMLPVMFLLFSCYFLFQKKAFWSTLMIFLALMSKQTVIIFFPIIIYAFWKKFSTKLTLLSGMLLGGLFYIFYLPFHDLDLLWAPKLYRLNFDLVAHSVSEQAFNIWSLIFRFKRVSDQGIFLFLTYQQIGYLLFLALMLYPTIKFLRSQVSQERMISLMLTVTLTFFLVLTRMHERYPAPAIAFLTYLLVRGKKYWIPLLFMTFFYLIHLYRDLFQPSWQSLTFIETNYNFLYGLIIAYIFLTGWKIYQDIKHD